MHIYLEYSLKGTIKYHLDVVLKEFAVIFLPWLN